MVRWGSRETFLSTPSARRATRYSLSLSATWSISIHALREEGDAHPVGQLFRRRISIHALREEGDCCYVVAAGASLVFLSTPSARRATTAASASSRSD